MGRWLGIWCGCESWELSKWADYLDGIGASESVIEYLRESSRIVGGHVSSGRDIERLREIEARAAASIERKRVTVSKLAGDIVGRVLSDGDVDLAQIMSAAGMHGWKAGRERGVGGGGNAGIQRNLTGTVVSGAGTAGSGKGTGTGTGSSGKASGSGGSGGSGGVGKGRPSLTRAGGSGLSGRVDGGRSAVGGRVLGAPARVPVTAADTRRKDREYAGKFEAWAAVRLCAMGFKMRHVSRGVGLDTSTTWRYVSSYRRHTKRMGLEGLSLPEVPADWEKRLEKCVELAMGGGMRGNRVVRSGVVAGAMERGEV